MKFDFRSYILGGELLERRQRGHPPAFTRIVPTADAVLAPHEVGDLIGAWALSMCMRDTLVGVESTFDDFVFMDRIVAKETAKTFVHTSPLAQLHWWEDRLPFLIDLENQLMAKNYVGLAVDVDNALAMVSAVEWFITRHRCRPPGVGEGLHAYQLQIDAQSTTLDPSEKTIANVPTGGIETLSPGDRQAVETMRAFEENEFNFLKLFADDVSAEAPTRPESEGADGANDDASAKLATDADKAPPGDKKFSEMDAVDQDLFDFVSVTRAIAPDGFRDEDRTAIDRFRRYVSIAVPQVQPLEARWIKGSYTEIGQRIFALGQLLFTSSFPNAESAKLREEELQANRAKMEREAKEKANAARGGSPFG